MNIYARDPALLARIAALVLILWTALIFLTNKWGWTKKAFKALYTLLTFIALYGILLYTVLGRSPSAEHRFVFTADFTNEFFREMFMNVLLYFPLGLTLTMLIGPWTIPAAFVLSLGIETWQYIAGTGLAQGTDVIMNTLGCAIGSIPWFVSRWIDRIVQKHSR